MEHDQDPVKRPNLPYIASFCGIVLLFNIIVTAVTWFCFNLISTISLTDAIVFVIIFRIIEWAKQTILEMCFD